MKNSEDIEIRPATREDWREVLAVHRRAVHELAADSYSPEVLAAWAPPLIDTEMPGQLAEFDLKLANSQVVLVAVAAGSIAGFGEIVPATSNLLALYVNPDFSRRGVGSAILRELEGQARLRQLRQLSMDASLCAEPFYRHHGYQVLDARWHALRSGVRMGCLRMQKHLT